MLKQGLAKRLVVGLIHNFCGQAHRAEPTASSRPREMVMAQRNARLQSQKVQCGAVRMLTCKIGEGVAQDIAEAVTWYRRAAEQGCAAAQSNPGSMYENGESVSQDYTEAVKWYRLSAEQGCALGQRNLGVMYANGWGVSQEYVKAF